MKVLLVGATGNVGLRLVAALLTHNHIVTAYVRSSSKLASLIPSSIYERLTVVEGNAFDSANIKQAILDNGCDAVINSAGLAALAPWGKSDLPEIFRSVATAVKDAAEERKRPIRAWFMGGLGALTYPGTETLLCDYIPVYLAHRQNLALLKSLPANTVHWSMLCPATMTPESSSVSVPTTSTSAPLIADGPTPPLFQDSWLRHVPLLGRRIVCAMNATKYDTTLEQNAEFIARDLESEAETGQSRWVGLTVGIIDGAVAAGGK